MRDKECIAVPEKKWEKYLLAFPQVIVYVENAQLIPSLRKRFPHRKISSLYPSRQEIKEEAREYLIPDLYAIVQAYTPKEEVFVRMWGKEGKGPGEFNYPSGISTLPSGEIIVADTSNHRIQFFDSKGKFQNMWGQVGGFHILGTLYYPKGIVALPFGNIAVVDSGNHRIEIFTSKGRFRNKIGIYGEERGLFQYPRDIALSPSGELYVTDAGNDRIQVFNQNLVFQRMWEVGKGGEYSLPYGITVLPSGEIAITNLNNRIQVFSPEGKLQREWGAEGSAAGEFKSPRGIVSSPSGEIFIADTDNHRIQVFTLDGKFLRMWGQSGEGEGEFRHPHGVTLLPSGEVVVLDTGNNRIQVFQTIRD